MDAPKKEKKRDEESKKERKRDDEQKREKKKEDESKKEKKTTEEETKKRKSDHSTKKSKRPRIGDVAGENIALVSSTVAELPDTTVDEKRGRRETNSPFDRRRLPSAPSSSSSQPSVAAAASGMSSSRPAINSTQPTSFQPTATPGQHAFITAPQSLSSMQQSLSLPRSSGLLPAPSTAFVGGLPPTAISNPMPTFMQQMPPTMHPPIVMPPQSVIITTDQPKLDGIPANNRIFVDGKAYEVFYIDDVAVIIRNTLPHRIYFNGPPRNVIIDGVAHSLAFGDRKTITIDGQPHVLRFGAPSRELYMGNYAFRGAFGGPPIFATINGIRHEIRLSGTPPEVRIEPEPSYELLPHINTLHHSQMMQSSAGGSAYPSFGGNSNQRQPTPKPAQPGIRFIV